MTTAADVAIIREDLDSLVTAHTALALHVGEVDKALEAIASALKSPTPVVTAKGKAAPKTVTKPTPEADVTPGSVTQVKSKAEAKRMRDAIPNLPNSTKWLCECGGYAIVSDSFCAKHVAKGHAITQLH